MKLRVRDNSIRIRLTRSEVLSLAEGNVIEQVTPFSRTNRLVSRIVPVAGSTVTMTFQGERIELHLSAEWIHQWANSEVIGTTIKQPIDETHFLIIIVEKDFQCLHPDHKQENDAYPHPADTSEKVK